MSALQRLRFASSSPSFSSTSSSPGAQELNSGANPRAPASHLMHVGGTSMPISRLCSAVLLVVAFPLASSAQNSPPPATPPPATATPAPDAAAPQDAASQDDDNGFVFKKEIEEVVLHATVVDDQNHLITALARDNFKVYEDGKLQEVTSFRQERVPVALGILIDNSGSMLPKRAKVNDAALRLVDASQQEDRVFVVNFGEAAFLDQDYTQDVGKLRAALQHVETRGSTALYDALIGAVDHLHKTSPAQKQILLVVTDGKDKASKETFQRALHKMKSR